MSRFASNADFDRARAIVSESAVDMLSFKAPLRATLAHKHVRPFHPDA